MKSFDLIVLTPTFNDGDSLKLLFPNVVASIMNLSKNSCIVVVDDGSIDPIVVKESYGILIDIVSLNRNVGHQKAIAIGLSYIEDNYHANYVLIMDSDGEDSPNEIPTLVQLASLSDCIIFASRTKRHEGFFFKIFYKCYKLIFKTLTGVSISFGNFCIVPFKHLKRLINMPEIWSHFSGSIIKSKLPYKLAPIEKAKRYAGYSKMNFQSLILHGLSSLSVHIETVTIRLLMSSVFFLFLSLMAMILLIAVKVFTNLALPGWTSTMLIGFTLLFLQALLFSTLLIFIILSHRSQKTMIPALDYKNFIEKSEIYK